RVRSNPQRLSGISARPVPIRRNAARGQWHAICFVECRMLRKALLVCGSLSSLVYVAMTVLVARQWPEYSSFSQTISELSAIDAPTRSTWAVPGAVYTVLVTLFG